MMSDIMRIRLLAMIDSEMSQVAKMISNENTWALGSTDESDARMHVQNMTELEEYQETLLKLREKVVEEELDV